MSYRKAVVISQPTIQPPLLPTHRQSRRPSGATALPHEVLLRLFTYLTSPKDRVACLQVCKGWYNVMNDHPLWTDRTVCLKSLLNAPQYCWDLLKRRSPSKFQVRLSAKNPRQLQSSFEQLRRLVETIQHVTSLHLLINCNISLADVTADKAVFGRLETLGFANVSNDSKTLDGLEAVLTHATNLRELEITGFRGFDLLSASHPDLVALKLSPRDAINPSHLSALLRNLPQLKLLELSTATPSDSKLTRKRIRLNYPWFLANSEDDVGHQQGPSKLSRIESLSLRGIRNVETSEVVSRGLPARMAVLTSLSIQDCDFSREALIAMVTGQKHLVHLNLSGTQCSDEVLKSLDNCPLKSLELRMCVQVTMEGLRHVSVMADSELDHLGLSHCTRVDPNGATLLLHMFPSLTSLDLSGWNLSSNALKTLAQHVQLRTLILRDVNVVTLHSTSQSRRCSIIT